MDFEERETVVVGRRGRSLNFEMTTFFHLPL